MPEDSTDLERLNPPAYRHVVVTRDGRRVAIPSTGDRELDQRLLRFALRGGELLPPHDRELGRAA